MEHGYSFWNDRTLCGVLEDMRKCYETRNFAALLALIEEAQMMGNRMEAGLGDKKEVAKREEALVRLKKEIRELEAKRVALKEAPGNQTS